MNKILSLFYRFRSIRLAWWRLKRKLEKTFNDREGIQELMDLGTRIIHLPNKVYHIDHTIYFSLPNTTLQGRNHGFPAQNFREVNEK